MFGEALDRATLACGVATLEDDDDLLAVLLHPGLELEQFDLQFPLAVLVLPPRHLRVVRVAVPPGLVLVGRVFAAGLAQQLPDFVYLRGHVDLVGACEFEGCGIAQLVHLQRLPLCAVARQAHEIVNGMSIDHIVSALDSKVAAELRTALDGSPVVTLDGMVLPDSAGDAVLELLTLLADGQSVALGAVATCSPRHRPRRSSRLRHLCPPARRLRRAAHRDARHPPPLPALRRHGLPGTVPAQKLITPGRA